MTKLPARRRILFALVPLAAILLLAELVTRLVRAPLYFGSFREMRTDLLRRNYPAELSPTLGYAPKPSVRSSDNHWGTIVSIDADGYRQNGPQPRPDGPLIAAVGDSFTFGDQVDDDATWPAQLEVAMHRPVVNGGVFGYSLAQAVLRAEAMLERFTVDTLVVSFIPDDLTRCEYRRRYTAVPWFEPDGDGLALRNVPVDHSEGSGDSQKAWKDALGHSALLDSILANTVRGWWFENEKQVVVPHLRGRGAEIGKRLLERIAARCKRTNTRLLVVLQGTTSEPMAVEVLDHAQQQHIATLDLASRFATANAQDPSLLNRWFAGHMTREGNAWVAHEIAAELQKPR